MTGPARCPICSAPGGFHDQASHAARCVPRELVYTRDAEGAWRRPGGRPLPALERGDMEVWTTGKPGTT